MHVKSIIISFLILCLSLPMWADDKRNTHGISLSDDPKVNEYLLSLYPWIGHPIARQMYDIKYFPCPKELTLKQFHKMASHLALSRFSDAHGHLAELAATGKCLPKDIELAERLLISDLYYTFSFARDLQEVPIKNFERVMTKITKYFADTNLLERPKIRKLLNSIKLSYQLGSQGYLKVAADLLQNKPVSGSDLLALKWAKSAVMHAHNKEDFFAALSFYTNPKLHAKINKYTMLYANSANMIHLIRTINASSRHAFETKNIEILASQLCIYEHYYSGPNKDISQIKSIKGKLSRGEIDPDIMKVIGNLPLEGSLKLPITSC